MSISAHAGPNSVSEPTPPEGSVATLTAALDRAATVTGRGVSILDRRESISRQSWAEIRDAAQQVAGGLWASGVRPGDRVALVHPTGFDFIVAFFGCLEAGAVPVPLYPPVRLGRLDEYHRRTVAMLDAVTVTTVLADARVRRLLGETVARARPPLGCLTLGELPTTEVPGPRPGDSELCLIQYSSGTTVEPKPVALSHRAVMTQVTTLNSFWPDTEEIQNSGVSWLPLYHDMGLIGCLCAAVERPGDLTLIPPELFIARPAVWLRTLSRTRATISPAPNFGYGLCVEKIRDDELEGVDLSSWRVALNGAETVVASVARSFCERFARWGFRASAMTPVYGLSEATLAVTFSSIDRSFTARRFSTPRLDGGGPVREDPRGSEIVSVGRPLPDCSVSIRDDSEVELPAGRAGRVWIHSPSAMSGYFGNREATHQVLRNGWLDSGDLGFLHRDELFLFGRAKDVLILRGRNHRPEDVESALDRVPGVRTGCCAAVSYLPAGASGEVLLVFVERRRGARLKAADKALLADRCRRAVLAAAGLDAHRIEVLEAGTLPRTSSGKIRRREALRLYLKGRLLPPERISRLGMLAAAVRSHLSLRGFERVRRLEDDS